MKGGPNAYDAWAGRILERPYVLCAPEILPDLGVLPRLPLGRDSAPVKPERKCILWRDSAHAALRHKRIW